MEFSAFSMLAHTEQQEYRRLRAAGSQGTAGVAADARTLGIADHDIGAVDVSTDEAFGAALFLEILVCRYGRVVGRRNASEAALPWAL